ncbi:phosphate ABC transporter substrate-binding protein [Glaciecola sp. XM2]|jgi:phosphate transport system substrate-binding protein|uniref:PstS family phosphate ABC transporter substrate-binding protein n=1 Tax=Glaciecola sp. XM2 TaxID=1914931 RepID=UPI001BDF54A3|nr:phosphate ABC transporter substrate-binding protein [Glaciecola sp. XM2]MBT1450385.1 phosphate ABC transporter substrate-binding protein [Glaciecola sp. XM2]
MMVAPTGAQSPSTEQENNERLSLEIADVQDANNLVFDYRSTPGVYGSITSIGSDTLANLVSLWAEQFQRLYPHVKFQIQASGSATASQALTQGTASIGPMSRALTLTEIQRFTRQYGYPPTSLIVAIDAMAIYVEKNNPLQQLSLEQIDAIFSMTRFCGGAREIRTWQALNIGKFGQTRTIQVFGRNSASGTYDLFKSLALCDGDYYTAVNEMPSSSSVVQSVASSIGGIGYAALGHGNTDVKALAIGQANGAYYAPNAQNITAGKYPFTRYLYIVVNKPPNEPLPTLERSFLAFILSEEGQSIVQEGNYYPVTGLLLNQQRRLINNNQ